DAASPFPKYSRAERPRHERRAGGRQGWPGPENRAKPLHLAARVYTSSVSERFHSAGSEQYFVEVLIACVEAEFCLFEEGGEACSAQAVELLMPALGIAPEALDAVDMD